MAVSVDPKALVEGERPIFNTSYGKLMMWFFLVTDAFTFSSLLISYGTHRIRSVTSGVPWAKPEEVFTHFPVLHELFHIDAPLAFVGLMTFILIISSVTMVLAVEAGHRKSKKEVEKWMIWTIVGGAAFLACQAYEWYHFIHGTEQGAMINGVLVHGANLKVNEYGPQAFADFFFFVTGFHGTHVFSGVVINIIIYFNTALGTYEKRGHYEMVEKVGLYWHFVDLVWVFVFTLFYLI
ncbi:MAG: cytochrome c oxidase subunit 3 [Bacteroidia bacterium]|nr:cytochrome c oxidase subunit 3 [Bacteroidia bacterium]